MGEALRVTLDDPLGQVSLIQCLTKLKFIKLPSSRFKAQTPGYSYADENAAKNASVN
jgi:hypothetical protein